MVNNFSDLNDALSDLLNSENGCEYTDLLETAVDLEESGMAEDTTLNILHVNIRSLHKNIDSLTLLLSDLHDKGAIVHIIGLCKTFLTEANNKLIDIENYMSVHRVRSSKPGSSVTVYIHDTVKLINVIDTPFNNCFESCAVEVMYKGRTFMANEFY